MQIVETIPNFDEIFERKTTEEVRSILDQHMSDGTGKDELEKFGSEDHESSSVEAAFNDLLNQ